jgi:hypothetical protein
MNPKRKPQQGYTVTFSDPRPPYIAIAAGSGFTVRAFELDV